METSQRMSLEDFLIKDTCGDRMEFIDSKVYHLESPSVIHQRVLLNLATSFNNYFKEKTCKVFIAPIDIWLTNNNKVQPDLATICDETGLREDKYIGIPVLIVEIMSNHQTHDRIRKYNLYMNSGVKEYWLVNAELKTIEVYFLEKEYSQVGIYKSNENVTSEIFAGLSIGLQDIF